MLSSIKRFLRQYLFLGWTFNALILLAGSSHSLHSASQQDAQIWYGPGTLNTVTRGIRDDFLQQFTDVKNWKTTYQEQPVFKQFIETIYPQTLASTGRPRYTDQDLARLAKFTREAGLKCAFEFGALRWSAKNHGKGSGIRYAQEEIELLRRWQRLGGSVDYLTTDHAVMWNLGLCLQGSKPMAPYVKDPDWREIADEVVQSLAMFKVAFPDVKIGMIESLGYFSITGGDGHAYQTTSPADIYPIDFKEFMEVMQQKLAAVNIELDHFHIDYSYQDCVFDAGNRGRKGLDFNRAIGAEKIIKSMGIQSGIIVNAYDDQTYAEIGGSNRVQEKQRAKNAEERSRSGVKNTLEYFDAYVESGGSPDTWIFQRWMPYPDRTGPESLESSDMGLTKQLVERLNDIPQQ